MSTSTRHTSIDTADSSLWTISSAVRHKPRVAVLESHAWDRPSSILRLASWQRHFGPRHVVPLSEFCGYCQKESDRHLLPYEKPYYEQCTHMTEWQSQSARPNCNDVHEIGFADPSTDNRILSMAGSWRSVWSYKNQNETAVMKLLKFQRREFDHESYGLHIVDAMAMDQLTSSKYVIDMYAFCGQTVLTEKATGSARLHIKDKSFGTLARLRMGRDVAHALAAIHSIDYPKSKNATLAHNDVNIANAVEVNGRIKFNDFNLAIPMKWNGTKPCGSAVRYRALLWKSPEENANISYIDPSLADIYGLGNLLFQVMTRHQPWTHLEPGGPLESEEVARRKIAGKLPFVPQKYAKSNKTSIQALYYATMACFEPDPRKRFNSYELAVRLDVLYLAQSRKKRILEGNIRQLFQNRSFALA